MELQEVKKAVYRANMELNQSGLVLYTFGNVSGIDRRRGLMVIKPSGVPYEELSPDNMVCVSIATGETVDSSLNPSSDTATHLALYREFPACGGIAHSHSEYATASAQARTPIKCMGTTQADYFFGDIPVTREMTEAETVENYEENTGRVIIETFKAEDPDRIPAVLVANHGPFTWGATPSKAVFHAVIAEFLAKMQLHAHQLNPQAPRPPQHLIEKHYLRKHGRQAYYGQPLKGK